MKNQAAWIMAKKGKPLEVESSPEPRAGPGQVVIKTRAIAINPVDWKIQDNGVYIENYPNILGQDAAGEVLEVGKDVTRYSIGDRVMIHCLGLWTRKPEHGGFQLYTTGFDSVSSPIPSSLSYEYAVALPLAISTAALGLHGKSYLGLPHPTKDAKRMNQVVLVNGGTSAVGHAAVQLAVASGVDVVVTAAPERFELVKSLGAKHVLDYKSKSLVDDATAELKKYGKFAGVYDAISEPSTISLCAEIIHNLGGGPMACTLSVPEDLPDSVKAAMCFGAALPDKDPELAKAIWKDFVPAALADGRLKAILEPIIVGNDLSSIQKGLERQKEGVSAAKVVITL